MQSNVLPMFPSEHKFTSRKTPANLSSGPEFVPEAPMWIDDVQRHCSSDYSLPSVNSRAPRDEILFNYSTAQIWLGLLALGAVLAFVICGAAYMGVSV